MTWRWLWINYGRIYISIEKKCPWPSRDETNMSNKDVNGPDHYNFVIYCSR